MNSFPQNSPAGSPPRPGRGLNAADGHPPARAAAAPDAADSRPGVRVTPSRGVARQGVPGPSPEPPGDGPAPDSLPVAEGRAGGAEGGPGGVQGSAGPLPAGEPGRGARLRQTAPLPGTTRPLAGQEFRDAWKAARSSNAAAGRRRGGKPKPAVQPGSGRLRVAAPRAEAFDDPPPPALRIKLPPEPPEAAL